LDERRPWIDVYAGIRIRRVPLLNEDGRGLKRHLNSIFFVLQAATILLFGAKRDVVWTATMPPLIQPLAVRLVTRLRREKFIYFVQDIYPEIALAMSMVKPGRLTSAWRFVDSWVMAKADAVVPHNTDMASTIEARGVRPKKLALINNFAPIVRDDEPERSGPCRFIYAGNVGRFQNLGRLIEIFKQVPAEKATLLILGEGAMKDELAGASVGAPHIEFRPIVPQEEAFRLISSADVGIVSLAPTLYRFAFPGKTFAYLSAGVRILALLEPDSELARELVDRDVGRACGWNAPSAELLETILSFTKTRVPHPEIRRRAFSMFDRDRVRAQWTSLFAEVMDAR
jgi:glycosyltransferase involved in cell wall biosynthesis